MQYVGMAKTPIRLRVIDHKSAIRERRTDATTEAYKLDEHFTQPDPDISHLSLTNLQTCDTANQLSADEKEWIWKLDTAFPNGILGLVYYVN